MKDRNIALFVITFFICACISAQNIVITDDDGYTADPSAMLDVKSATKGFLVPRMTTVQRIAIASPATGLLVFDTNDNCYYFFNGSAWTTISYGQIWQTNGTSVYLSDPNDNVGVGTSSPTGKMEVKGDASIGLNEPLFAVVNANSDTVFAVYNEGVRIWVNDDASKASGNRGGFAVGGFCPSKATTNEYLRVTPDSVRIYIQEDYGAKASGNRGGFAVGGFAPSKGITDDYLFVADDSSRIWTYGDGGFQIKDLETGSNNYLNLTPDNYFIGHQSGDSNTVGLFNTFLGYQTGLNNINGSYNAFLGYQTGYENESGEGNLFLGFQSGYSNKSGSYNSFVGYQTGYNNTTGTGNSFLGSYSGLNNTIGNNNTFVGVNSGKSNSSGNSNAFVGTLSGFSNTSGYSNVFFGPGCGYKNEDGIYNVFIGANAGYENKSGVSNIFIGTDAGFSNIGSATTYEGCFNLFMGQGAGMFNVTGKYNVFMGYQSGFNNNSGVSNCFIGPQSGHENTSGIQNIFIGENAGYSNQTGSVNTFIGWNAGNQNTVGNNNIFIGKEAGFLNIGGANDAGSYNIFIGDESGNRNTTGKFNTFIGFRSGYFNVSGRYNCAMGWYSGHYLSTGDANVFLGISSGQNCSTGNSNVFVGNQAGSHNVAGGYNTYIGYGAGSWGNAGSVNTYIGNTAGQVNIGSGNVFIGNEAGYQENNTSNKLYIANSQTNTLIYGDFAFATKKLVFYAPVAVNRPITYTPAEALDVLGSVRTISGASGTNCYFVLGKTADEGRIATVAANSQWFANTVAGDIILRNESSTNKIHLGCNGFAIPALTVMDGRVGINGTNPGYSLDVVGRARLQYGSGLSAGHWLTTSTGTDRAFIGMMDDNTVGFYGTGIPGWGFYMSAVSGEVYIPRAYTATVGSTYRDLYVDASGLLGYLSSSAKYKKNIADMESVDWIYKLRPVNYIYKDNAENRKEYGLIAEEVESINNHFVSYNPDGSVETVQYSQFISPMLKAIQDQKKEIEFLKKENEILKSKIEDHKTDKNEIEKLKAEIEKINSILNNTVKK